MDLAEKQKQKKSSTVLVYFSLIKEWRVKGSLTIKVLVLWPPELELCILRKAK